jgi:hypothetical protein
MAGFCIYSCAGFGFLVSVCFFKSSINEFLDGNYNKAILAMLFGVYALLVSFGSIYLFLQK